MGFFFLLGQEKKGDGSEEQYAKIKKKENEDVEEIQKRWEKGIYVG